MPFARSPRPEKPNLTAFSDRLLRLPAPSSARYAAFFVKEGGGEQDKPGLRAERGTGHKGNSGTPSRKDRARQRADPIGVQPYSVGNVNYTERKIGMRYPQKNRGAFSAHKGKQCHESGCFFCTKLWITCAHFLCASTLFLRLSSCLSTSVCTTAPDLCTISSFSVDKHRFLRRRIFFRKGVNTCRKRFAAGCTGCPSCPIKAAAGRSAPSAVSPERRPRANLISGRIRNGILVQLLQ